MNALEGKRVLLTGATGFLGGKLLERLCRINAVTGCLMRNNRNIALCVGAERLETTGCAADTIETICQFRPDVMIHCAGLVQTTHGPDDIDTMLQSNVQLAAALFEAGRQLGELRIVNLGTYLEYSSDGKIAPTSLYAASKRAVTELLNYYTHAVPTRAISIKPSVIYGAGDPRPRLLPSLAKAIANGQTLCLSEGLQKLDLIHIDDVVEALIQASVHLLSSESKTGHQEYFAVSGNRLSIRELAQKLEQIVGREADLHWGAHSYRPEEVMEPFSGGTPLPGWSPAVPLELGLAELVFQQGN
ncbi:NAD(P)-dependent oxidoreductase [Phaeobacter inhibens]|uniref:NAD-dependent epimerase/dehydratase family protein n=1 Tax=Phaeobacter inhibens TaxID=221822 RepID=UPI0021A4489B|nr:NAD(P)-dependent oxidoreductase [Phaeobacter inhibens]UWR74818.1 NAD(P)-dependent oxidoreductase [Phaeobacter inhibens]